MVMGRKTGREADNDNQWVIVLAAGDGTRLQALTRDRKGRPRPKQYCALVGEKTLLRQTLERAEGLVAPDRVVVVVAADHARLWEPELADHPRQNLVVQPENRGTAAAVLLGLLHVLFRDPQADVLFLPSDHFVADEEVLQRSLRAVLWRVSQQPGRLVLLGIAPTGSDTEYGWILPRRRPFPELDLVSGFWEKPTSEHAARLRAGGALWNSSIFAVHGELLAELFAWHLPEVFRPFLGLWKALRQGWHQDRIQDVFAELPDRDLSRDLLERCVERLSVLPVPRCGWADLGTPERLWQCLTSQQAASPAAGLAAAP